MVGWASDLDGVAAESFCDCAEDGVRFGAEFAICQVWRTMLSREDDVD